MLHIAFELIGEATSNSLLMFCFCNLIIVMIFTGSSKPGSMGSQDSTFVNPVSYDMCYIASDDHDRVDDHDDGAMNIAAVVPSVQDEPLIDDSSSDEEEDREISHCYADDDDDDFSDEDEDDSDNDDDDESKEAEDEEEEGDDDLRTRVEEFIAKINNEWRHEKLKALNLVY
ncbi:PREDICTED: nucleolin-like [Camelina sativa]|uniref:Nucleolin-like n=1 Tax=Camelina sativa TaxID=90675 RepID=A0ABM1QUA6_CAMSA|nr:PREDICTED: nucleolin-like [Camelina sativa]